jgi:hypothetical protein
MKFIVTLLVVCLIGCEGDFRLKIKNNSNKPIYYLAGYTYPDTTIPITETFMDGSPITEYPGNFRCDSGKLNRYLQMRSWDGMFTRLPKDTLMLFIFDADTIDHIPWETVRHSYNILKRFDFTKADLENRNWIVTYP